MRLLVPALLMTLTAANAQAGNVYKWIDDKGTTHYSSQPPAGKTAEAIKIHGTSPALSTEEEQAVEELPTSPGSAPPTKDPVKCENARNTYQELMSGEEIRTQDPETGDYRKVRSSELEQWRNWVTAEIRDYCP